MYASSVDWQIQPQSSFRLAVERDGGFLAEGIDIVLGSDHLGPAPLRNWYIVSDLQPTYLVDSNLVDVTNRALMFIFYAGDRVGVIRVAYFRAC
jgi:hypothetical protein